jgi:general secretion pathway protein G
MKISRRALKSKLLFLLLVLIASMGFVLVLQNLLDYGSGRRWILRKQRVAFFEIESLDTALDVFKSDKGYYPSGTNALNDLIVKPAGATNWQLYYQGRDNKIPLDPWGHPYLYECPRKHRTNSYDLSSAGPDGKFGTDDDIANWRSP